jgi:hypothetical protein
VLVMIAFLGVSAHTSCECPRLSMRSEPGVS